MAYATADDVRRVQPRAISASSVPTTTQVDAEITSVEQYLNRLLSTFGITSPITDADGKAILASYVARKVGAFVLTNKRSVEDDQTTGSEEANALLDKWDELEADIKNRPAYVAKLLGHPMSAANRGTFRSHVIDNTQGLSNADGDFDPTFRKDDEL